MLKLLDRFGTEQHKYRLGLHFTSLYVGGQAYLPPGVLHRIVLQRGSKKYSSNYLTVRAAYDNPIDEKIQIKATVYFDVSRQQYQEKKFDIVILRKDVYAETTVAKFAFMAESHLSFRGEQVVYQDSLNRLIANVYCERIDGVAGNDDRSTSSISGRSSIDRSVEMRRRSQPRESMPSISHMLVQAGLPSPSSQVGYSQRSFQPHHQHPHHQVQHPNDEIRKSIVEQVRFDFDRGTPKEALRGSQQRSNHHIGHPLEVHYNHPQHGGYPIQYPDYGMRLPPQSPPKMQSQLPTPTSQLNRQAAMLLQGTNPNALIQQASPKHTNNVIQQQPHHEQQQSRTKLQSQQVNPFAQLTAKLAEQAISKPASAPYQPNGNIPLPQYSSQPPLEALRENFRIQVSNPEQTEQELKLKASNPRQLPQLQIGLVTNIPMLPSPSMKTSKPRLEDSKKPQSPAPTFKDLINLDSEKLPTYKKSASKKESLELTDNVADQLLVRSKEKNQVPTDTAVQSSVLRGILTGPDITAVDSQFIEAPKPQLVCAEAPAMEVLPSPASIQQAKESCMTASFKNQANYDDRLLNASFESPKFIGSDDNEYQKRQQILKEQLQRERESYRQDLSQRRQLQQEKDSAYDNEIRLLNQRIASEGEKYQQEIAMRDQFIDQKMAALDKLKAQLDDFTREKEELTVQLTQSNQENGELRTMNQQHKQTIEQLQAATGNLQTNLDVLSSQHSMLRVQFDNLSSEHERARLQNQQAQREYNRLVESHADLNEHKASVNQINNDVKARLDEALLELEHVNQAKLSLEGDNGRLSNDLRMLHQQCEQLNAHNMELQGEVNKLKAHIEQTHNSMGRDYERLTIFNRNSIGEMEELRAQNELLSKKQQDLLQKYIKNFNDLNAERLEKERLEKRVQELQVRSSDMPMEIRKRQQTIVQLHNQIKSMEFTMVNPEEDPNYHKLRQQNQQFQQQLQSLAQQMQQESAHLQAELTTKQNHIELLNDKLTKTQNILNETMTIYAVKEQSLNEALTVKDRRLAELEKQSDRLSSRSQITVKYAHTDQDKRQLLLKIEVLQSEVQRLTDLEDEIAVVEAINKDLELRVKQLTSEILTYKQQPKLADRRSAANVEDLQAELARTNTKLAQMLQFVFRRNPSLAHQLARIKV